MLAFVFMALALGDSPAPASNPLLDELLAKGLPAGGATLRLPAPAMPDGLDARRQRAILDRAAGSHPIELFLRKSDDAPFTIKIDSVDGPGGKRLGQTVAVQFVAHGPLTAVTRGDSLDRLLGTAERRPAGGSVRQANTLAPEALSRRGIAVKGTASLEERYSRLEFVLLDKVMITGVAHSIRSTTGESVTAAMKLDPRFADDAEFPNRWRSVNRLADDAEQLGPPQPYAGLGGYVRVTALREPAGALFVEAHTAFHEPPGWFEGHNVLRSKLPLVTRENVRTFRRALGRPTDAR